MIDSNVDDAQPAPARVRLAVAGARAIDWSLAGLRLAEPVALVSGFWRSGTTWVQECLAESLGAKTVFEPLSPVDRGRRAQLVGQVPGGEDALQAFIPPPCPAEDPLWTLLDAAFTGRHSSNFLLSCRPDVAESFKRRIVVKDVRLQFNLPGIHRRFAVPVVHVRRHPGAVVASLLAADWHWSFERVRLSDILPAPSGEAVRAFDTDALSRIAAYWAVTERQVAASLEGQPWARTVTYEDIVASPSAVFADLCRWVGRAQICTAAFDRPSASAHPGSFPPSGRNVHDRWRQSLSEAQVDRIARIVDDLHPAWRDVWPGVSTPAPQ